MDASLLDVRDLQFAWPGQPRLLDLPRLQLQVGERLFLHGPSGSGKTTLLSLIGGVLVPGQGDICLQGQSLQALSPSGRDRWRADQVGFIFQQFNLLPFLSVLDNVLLGCRFSPARRQRAVQRHGSPDQAARQLLQHLQLPDALFGVRADRLSIGQQQRVAAARALLGSPPLIIADEPTSALDHPRRERFLELLFRECAELGSGLLFVSHDQGLAAAFDRSESLSTLNRVAADMQEGD